MSTWVALEPLSVPVEAGGEAEASLRIRNTSDIVEEYHVDVVGDPAMWCTAEPATLRLYPGTTGTVRLTFAPPKGPDPAAGPHPYGVRVRPVEAPDAVTVSEGNVIVQPFTDLRAELLPVIVRGWSRAKPWLVVDNYGNTPATLSVQAAVQDQSVDFDTREPSFQIPPGRAHFGVFTGRPQRLLWAGHNVRHPYAANVIPSGSSPAMNVNGTYLQTALIPTWLSRLLALLIALLIAFIALWMLAKPSLKSNLQEKSLSLAPASNSSSAPSASASPSSAASQAVAASAPAAAPVSGGGGGGAGAGNGQPQPIGYWKMIEGASNTPATTAVDSSPGQHPLNGQATWCQNGGCAWFNGQNSQLTTASPVVDTTKSFTVAAYVNLYSVPTDGSSDTAVGQDAKGQSSFFLQYSGQDNCWAFATGNGRADAKSVPVTANTWVYLTGVFDAPSDTMSLYVNGTQAGTLPGAQLTQGSGPLSVGRAEFNGGPTDWWNGGIKNVEIFNQALNASQIQTLARQNSH